MTFPLAIRVFVTVLSLATTYSWAVETVAIENDDVLVECLVTEGTKDLSGAVFLGGLTDALRARTLESISLMAARGVPRAQSIKGVAILRGAYPGNGRPEAEALFRSAAEKMDQMGSLELAKLMIIDYEVKPNQQTAEAAIRILESTSLTMSEAGMHLGVIYYNGNMGVHKDIARSLTYFAKSARLGSQESAYYLGLHFQALINGQVEKKVRVDLARRAIRWYALASCAEHHDAMRRLAGMLYGGDEECLSLSGAALLTKRLELLGDEKAGALSTQIMENWRRQDKETLAQEAAKNFRTSLFSMIAPVIAPMSLANLDTPTPPPPPPPHK